MQPRRLRRNRPCRTSLADGETQDQEVTVTGTRIVRDGYSAPTPVSVISTEEISREAPANISDFVNTLPSVRGSGTSANSNGALSNGGAGINTVNLRSLGANRTLVLVDGQRSVPSTNTGSVDVNTIPQALIERVEVVTGGASSAYGSDAVSGVVNFILNKKFTGLKAEYEHGVTTYGDAPNHKASITAGTSFADGRGHITVSGEYFTQKGIHTIDRDWNDVGFFRVNNPKYTGAACTDSSATTICYPEYIVTKDAGISSFAPGGLVTFGPLKGIYFGSINPATGFASVNKLNFGAVQPGSQWMIGGDTDITSASHRGSATLQPSERRQSAFGRLSYEFSPALNVFAQFAYSRYRGQSYYQQTATTATSATTGVLINNDNAYLPPEVKALMAANNLTSIRVGTGNVFIDPRGSDNTREVFRYVVGADGQFNALGRSWSWDAYYQRGETKTNEQLTNGWSLTRYALATDAVVVTAANRGSSGLALGSIACRSTLTSPTNGCVPVNVLGVQPNRGGGRRLPDLWRPESASQPDADPGCRGRKLLDQQSVRAACRPGVAGLRRRMAQGNRQRHGRSAVPAGPGCGQQSRPDLALRQLPGQSRQIFREGRLHRNRRPDHQGHGFQRRLPPDRLFELWQRHHLEGRPHLADHR